MLEPNLISRIRHIFLQPRPHVSSMQAEGLLGWSRRQMSEAIENGEVELWTTPLGKWFPRSEMMAKALEIWPMHVIEEALGDDADGILPQAIRSAELRVRLPRHHIDMLPPSAACWNGSWTASPARTSRSCRRRCRGSPRRWRGRPADKKLYPQMTQMNADGGRFYLRTSASSADKPCVNAPARNRL